MLGVSVMYELLTKGVGVTACLLGLILLVLGMSGLKMVGPAMWFRVEAALGLALVVFGAFVVLVS